MLDFGNILFASLLWLYAFGRLVCATEPLRAPADPYLVSPPGLRQDDGRDQQRDNGADLEFTLKHIYHHGIHKHPDLHRYRDIPADAKVLVADDTKIHVPPRKLQARFISTDIQRLVDRSRSGIDGLLDYAYTFGQSKSLPASAWTTDQTNGPDINDKKTVIGLAWMAANAYLENQDLDDWHEVGKKFNSTDHFGWEQDGLRGHIFGTLDNSTIVIGLKGTSTAIFFGDETSEKDRENDNLFGSCCCAQGGASSWTQVCDCMTDYWNCNQTCLVQELRQKSRYYEAAQDLYHNVTERYPNSEIWLSGHSLGGVVSALLGLTYGLPTVTFEAYPDAMAASRLGLPVPPGFRVGAHQSRTDVGVHHFGHTADPIFTGDSSSHWSWPSIGGFAFEGVCHTGKKCAYDTINDLNWRSHIRWHSIIGVIRDVLEKYDTTANCTTQLECTDCYKWKFYESNSSDPTTTRTSMSTSTYTRTRTEICKTPGWWGCRDETSTTTSGRTSTTSTTSTSTCKTPGWFGCKDPTTTTTSSTTTTGHATTGPAITTVTTTTTMTPPQTTCETPGWFGDCKDSVTTTTAAPQPSNFPYHPGPSATGTSGTSTICNSPIWFGLGCADPVATSIPSSTPSHSPVPGRKTCVRRHWYGLCAEWRWESDDAVKSDL